MSNLIKNFNVNESKMIVPMTYTQLKELMCECVALSIENYKKEQMKASTQKWVSTKEAAAMFGCNASTINRWKHKGYLTPRLIGGKDYFSVEEIENIKYSAA